MSRSRRRDWTTLVAVAIVIAAALVLVSLALPPKTDAVPRTAPSCWWEGTTVRATGLPTTRAFGITFTVPHGVSIWSGDGTFERELGRTGDLVFYTRGGGGALFKWGAQFNDYHPICVAIP